MNDSTDSDTISQKSTDSSVSITFRDLYLLGPVSIINPLCFSFSQYGLKELQISLFDQIKRCSPLFSLLLFYLFSYLSAIRSGSRESGTDCETETCENKLENQKASKKYTPLQVISILIIATGGAITFIGADDELVPVILAFTSVFLKSLYLNLTQTLRSNYTPSSFNLKVSMLSILVLPITCYVLEWRQVSCLMTDLFDVESLRGNCYGQTNATTENFDDYPEPSKQTQQISYSWLAMGLLLIAQSLLGILMKEIHTRSCVIVGAVETSVMTTGKSLLTTIIDIVADVPSKDLSLPFIVGLGLSFFGTISMTVSKTYRYFTRCCYHPRNVSAETDFSNRVRTVEIQTEKPHKSNSNRSRSKSRANTVFDDVTKSESLMLSHRYNKNRSTMVIDYDAQPDQLLDGSENMTDTEGDCERVNLEKSRGEYTLTMVRSRSRYSTE